MAAVKILNFMAFLSPTLDGRIPGPMDDAALGLASGVYFNDIWKAGNANGTDPRIDVAKVQSGANCLPWGAEVLVDVEYLVGKMKINTVVNGVNVFVPNPGRLEYQMEFVKAVNAIRSTPRGAAAKIMMYHSTMGSVHADNPPVWFENWRASNDTLIEPVPGAPNGVARLFDRQIGRCYRDYVDATLDARNIAIIGAELDRLYPGQTHVGLLQPRKSGSNWGAERFDYLSKSQFATSLAAAKGNFDWLGIWNAGIYGPEGWPYRQPGTFYAIKAPGSNTVVGDEFSTAAGWWQAVQDLQRGGPVVTTIPYNAGGGSSLGGSGVR